MAFGSRDSGRRNYAAHGYSSSLIVLGYAAYMFFQSPPALDKVKTTAAVFESCDVERHSGRHSHSSHVVLHVLPAGEGQQESFELEPSPWPTSQSCTALNPYVGRTVTISHSANPDPMGYLTGYFRDIVWQLQDGGQTVIDYPAQASRWQKRSQWMAKFAGGFGLLLLVIALFEHRRGTD